MGNVFSTLEIRRAVGGEVGSHNVWSTDQSKDRPTSLLCHIEIIIKKGYVVFIILYVNNVDKILYLTIQSYFDVW